MDPHDMVLSGNTGGGFSLSAQPMRAFALLLFVLFTGCGRTTLQTVESVNAPTGKDRLIRKAWESMSFSNPGERSYD